MPIAMRPVRGLLALVSLAALGASAPDPIIEVERPPPPIDMAVAGAKVFDALVLRPLGACGTVVGAAAFVIAAPLSSYAVGFGTVWNTLVMEPVDFTFRRPLGEF